MNIISIIKRILNYKSTSKWGMRSSSNFVTYLRRGGVKVGENVKFRYPKHTVIDMNRPSLIEIGNNVDINDNFTIMTHDFGTYVLRNLYHDFVASSGRVKIGNNIYFGRDVTILKGVTIGDNCIIGLGSIVTRDIPSNSVATGVPCRVVCGIEEYYQKRRKLQVKEAIELGVSIIENLNRQPVITDFKEEWVLFLTEPEMEKYPEILPQVNLRIGNIKEEFFKQRILYFNGWEAFLNEINNEYKSRHKL